MDRESGRSKGFGFVEMSTEAEAQDAIAQLTAPTTDGRAMIVNEARPMEPRAPRTGFVWRRRRWRWKSRPRSPAADSVVAAAVAVVVTSLSDLQARAKTARAFFLYAFY